MNTIENFPHDTEVLDPVFITLSDGVRLAARVWLPKDAADNPVPAILEYLPYRRHDGTAVRDAMNHPYFAGHGYASVRVDMRGAGDSNGILLGEYLKQEQDDALEVIDWLTAQPWCSGAVGMIGISWGGFNGLQIAARRPAALKAIVSVCSTDDRYADDVHYMGGCMLYENAAWNGAMFSINSSPPDPDVLGNEWFDVWMDRLKGSGFWLEDWYTHQRRDAFWQHGSVCENYDDIEAAVYAVGGWGDGYSNAIFRLVENLKAPCKGLVGPWGHKYPHYAEPGPAIGFLQECLRWWDYWLKGIDTGIMDEPKLRCWIEEPAPPQTMYEERPGRWVADPSWPSPHVDQTTYYLNDQGIEPSAGSAVAKAICSPATVGMKGGQWCGSGMMSMPDMATDQREEAGGSLVFDSAPLAEAFEILGAPQVTLNLSSDTPTGMVAVCLSEVMPDGAVTRVSYGLLNLTHRDSHEHPEPMVPGQSYRVRVQLNEIGHRFEAGNKIQIAVSTNYWPIAWPSPERTTLSVIAGESTLELPVRRAHAGDNDLRAFEEPEASPPLDMTVIRPFTFDWTFTRDMQTGVVTQHQWFDEGCAVYNEHDGWTMGSTHDETFSVHPDDPTSARVELIWTEVYERGAWQVSSRTRTVVTSTKTHFRIVGELEAKHGDEVIHEQVWDREIPRDLV